MAQRGSAGGRGSAPDPAENAADAAPRKARSRGDRGRSAGRVTITDIAREAGVTATAVSLAVNGRPGVSDSTRERIMRIAHDLRWEPSHAARALAGAQVRCVGMVLARPAEVLGREAFFGAFVAGLQGELSGRDYSLQMKMVASTKDEVETYRRWFAQGRVDGVVVLDLRVADPRIAVLEEIGSPVVVVGGPGHHGSLPAVWVDDARAITLVLDHLHGLGHQRIARISGGAEYLHTTIRSEAFSSALVERGLWGHQLEAGFDGAATAKVTQQLLDSSARPTAIVFDSDEMALAGVEVIQRAGLRIPEDLSVVSIEDSSLARLHRPGITAIGRSAVDYGRAAARRLLEVLGETAPASDASAGSPAGEDVPGAADERRVIEPVLEVRGSTGPAPDQV